jgi:hypothetical protein
MAHKDFLEKPITIIRLSALIATLWWIISNCCAKYGENFQRF